MPVLAFVAKTDRQRAEACFAVARSTSHDGEREAAIGRGLAICERAGLDPDTFDIPGRAPAKPQPMPPPPGSRYRDDLFARGGSPFWTKSATAHDLWDALRRYADSMERSRQEAEARPDETVHDARRRNFDEATTDAKRRDEARKHRSDAERAVDFLSGAGVEVYKADDGEGGLIWIARYSYGWRELSDEAVVQLAKEVRARQQAASPYAAFRPYGTRKP